MCILEIKKYLLIYKREMDNMNRDEMQKINEEIHFAGYARNKVKSMGNEIADLTGKIELLSGMVEEGLLDVEIYKTYVFRQKKEIKDMLAEIYSYLKLEDIKGRYDEAFKKEK
jgi:hypothetical protein